MQRVYDFYKQVLGRDSYDNRGSRIVNIVNPLHIKTETGHALVVEEPNASAFHYPMPYMIYGRGDMSEGSDEQTELTTMAHEFTHHVTSRTAVLGGFNEPGALNEAISDIFGVAVFDHVLNTDGKLPLDYLYAIGQDSERTEPSGNTRSLKNPWVNKIPKAIEGRYWINPEAVSDRGGIHSNCGPLGFWFYLLSEGYQPARDTLDYTVVDPDFITSVQTDGWQGRPMAGKASAARKPSNSSIACWSTTSTREPTTVPSITSRRPLPSTWAGAMTARHTRRL